MGWDAGRGEVEEQEKGREGLLGLVYNMKGNFLIKKDEKNQVECA